MKLNKTKQILKDYSNGVPDAPEEKLMFMIEKINKFCHQIKNLTSGEETQVLINGMRYINKLRKVFEEWNSFLEKQTLNFRDDLRNEIRDFENNYCGKELPGYVNYKTFESLVRDNIVELEEPAINKLKVATELTRTASIEITEEHFKAFSNLFKFAKIKIESISHQQESEAEKMLKAQFKIENMVYSQDKIYSSNLSTTKNTPSIFGANATVQEMSHHVQTYYKIASYRLADQIPLVICYHILREFANKLQGEMLTLLQDRDRIDEYLFEDQDTKRKRETLQSQMSRPIKAHKALLEFA